MTEARRLHFSPRAVADLDELTEYLLREAPSRGSAFAAALEAKCRAVAAAPDLYPARPDIADGLRMAVHGRYLVLFRHFREDGVVRIERVVHGARHLPRLF